MQNRKRADIFLVEKGFYQSRTRAQEAITAGLVKIDGEILQKASQMVFSDARVEAEQPHEFVSRGGMKLEAALQHFHCTVRGMTCLDLGASTGGFTEVLLRHEALKVYAVDVGHGQLHEKLREDDRVINLEKTDARSLTPDLIPEAIDCIVSDVSFISLKLVLPAAVAFTKSDAQLIILVKPQFEAGKAAVKKGIVRDKHIHEQVCREMQTFVEELGFSVEGIIPSPITGGDGNTEFLLVAHRKG